MTSSVNITRIRCFLTCCFLIFRCVYYVIERKVSSTYLHHLTVALRMFANSISPQRYFRLLFTSKRRMKKKTFAMIRALNHIQFIVRYVFTSASTGNKSCWLQFT